MRQELKAGSLGLGDMGITGRLDPEPLGGREALESEGCLAAGDSGVLLDDKILYWPGNAQGGAQGLGVPSGGL